MAGYNESNAALAAQGLMLNLLLREVHTAMPGRVEGVYIEGGVRFVEVMPLLRRATIEWEQIEMKKPIGVLLLTIGTSASSVLMPVQAGDLVLLVFSERALEHWKRNTEIADTIYGRQFDLSDGFAVPFNFKGLDPGYNNEDMIVEHNSQKITVKNNGDIEVGGSSLKKMINEEFKDLFNNHVHNYVGFIGSGTVTPGVTGTPASASGVGTPDPGQCPIQLPLPTTGLLPGLMDNSHMTSKVKAQ